jgi:hypothetical protein
MRTVLRLHLAGGLALALLFWAPPSAAVAQTAAAPAAARRLRVIWGDDTDRRTAIGRGWRDGDTLRFRTDTREVVNIPTPAIRRLDVSVRRRRLWWQGAAVGAAIGGTIGALVGNSSYNSCQRDGVICLFSSDRRVNDVLIGAAIYGIPSTVLGTGVGALTRRDVWRDSTALVRP